MKTNLSTRCANHIRYLTSICLFAAALPAQSALLVDTGPGPAGLPGNLWVFNGGDKLAGQFTLATDTSIGSIQGWMGIDTFVTSGFNFDIHIYSDLHGLPELSMFSGSAFAAAPTNVPAGEEYGFDWHGLSGLNWNLAPGTYWVTFEGTNPIQSALMPGPSVNPLARYSTNTVVTNGAWVAADDLKLGIRIEGSPVPIPSAIWLLGSGLFGLIGFAARRQASAE